MRDKGVSEDLQNDVKAFIFYHLKYEKERDKEAEESLITMLPANIRAKLYYEVNTFFFENFAWTDRFSD